MVQVKVRDNEPFERALRRFRHLCQREGILRGLKERRFYQKPSEERRRRMMDARRRLKRNQA